MLNEIITDINFDNQQIKNLLMNYFSEGISFTYLNNKKIANLFSTNFCAGEIAESLPSKTSDNVIIASMHKNIINKVFNSYKSDIDNSYCDAND